MTTPRRRAILEAALSCFNELGYERTTMMDIRCRSEASIGSIYHHFSSKEQLAAALYLEGIRDYQSGFLQVLERHATAKDTICALVTYHLQWIEKNPAWARFLLAMRQAEFMIHTEQTIRQQNRTFLQKVAKWFAPRVAAGELRSLPEDLYVSVLLGPCQEFARLHFLGRTRTTLSSARPLLCETTWQALKGTAHSQ